MEPCGRDRHSHDIAKPLAISARNLIARVYFVRKNFQLLDQNCRLNGIETRSEADADIVIFIAAVPMHAQASERVCHSVVIGHHRTAVAITTERLGGEETGRRGVTKSAQSTVVVGRTKALSGIIENEQAFGFRRHSNRAVVSRQPEQVNRNDRFGF